MLYFDFSWVTEGPISVAKQDDTLITKLGLLISCSILSWIIDELLLTNIMYWVGEKNNKY